MFCPNCGKKIPKDTNFCPFCGHVINVGNSIHQPKPNVVPHLHRKYKPNYHNPRFYNERNPKKITKKAKILLAGIFAVAVIGGITHHVYKNSPAGINLEKQVDNHVYAAKGFSDIVSDNDLFHPSSDFDANSDRNNEISFEGGSVKPYSSSSDPSDGDNIDYSIKGKTLTISDGTIAHTDPDSDSDVGKNGSDTGNFIKFKLSRTSDNDKKLTFYPVSFSAKDNDGGKTKSIPSSKGKKLKLTLKEVRKLNS